jgi:hypothetical protein
MGLFLVGVPKKRKKDFRTFYGAIFANNIYLKNNLVGKIEYFNLK